MSNFAILRIARLKNVRVISASAQHAFRERTTPNADASRKWMNDIEGATSSMEVITAVDKRIKAVDVVDKHAVRCIEYLITASPEQFKPGGRLEDLGTYDYLQDSLEWIKRKHGAENVVCSVIHEDESTPHMTVYVVPVVKRGATTRKRSVGVKGGGRELREYPVPERSELSAKHYFGNREKLSQLQTDFAEQVGKKYGLKRGVHRAAGDERVCHTKLKTWYAGLPSIQKEINDQKANLEASRLKLEEDLRALDQERQKLAVEFSRFDKIRFDLDQREVETIETRKQIEADKAGLSRERSLLARVRQGLDRRESELIDREAALDQLEVDRKVKVEEVKATLRSWELTIKQDSVAFQKDVAEFQAATQIYSPIQIVDGIKSLQKANVQPQGRRR